MHKEEVKIIRCQTKLLRSTADAMKRLGDMKYGGNRELAIREACEEKEAKLSKKN